MKSVTRSLVLVVCVIVAGCTNSTKQDTETQHTGEEKTVKQGTDTKATTFPEFNFFSPYIGTGFAGKITSSDVTEIYGVVAGQTIDGGWEEQWFLAKSNNSLGHGLTLKQFPNCLPTATAKGADTFAWHWATLPDGAAAPKMSGADFYEYVTGANFLNGDLSQIRYVFGTGMSSESGPAQNKLSPNPDDVGVVEAFVVDGHLDCKWEVFALPFKDCPPPKPGETVCFGQPFEQYRRVLQAWTETDCKLIDATDKDRYLVTAKPVSEMKYGDWQKSVSEWPNKPIWSTNGRVLRDDNGDVKWTHEQLRNMDMVKPFFAEP